MKSYETPVLIVGGGPVGLAVALDLGLRGDESIVVERDHKTGAELLAKAGTLNERTMEICRRWGVAEAVASCGFPDDVNLDNVYCTGLDGLLIGRDERPCTRDRTPPTGAPEMLRKCPQFQFDPILANAVQRTGKSNVLYSHQFESFEQHEEGVTARLTDLRNGEPVTVRARYMVACDGAGSAVRRALGLSFNGKMLSYSVSAMIDSAGVAESKMGLANRYMFIDEEGTWANLTAVDGRDLWRFTLVGNEEKLDPKVHDISQDIRRAFGPNIPFKILRVVPWRRSQCLIECMRVGRVLFAGDSAHTTSPTGGHGLNTGIGDAVAASWMLHAVLNGEGGEGLLDAYDLERRPVALRNITISTVNFSNWIGATDFSAVLDETLEGDAARARVGAALSASLHQEWTSHGVALAYRFEGSPLIVPDGTPEPADEVTTYTQTARPGHRAPHAWLADGRSTVDLFGSGYVLLSFGASSVDENAILEAAKARRVPMRLERLADAAIAALYERKLVMVRPDGHVCWRADVAPSEVEALIARVSGNVARGSTTAAVA